MWRCTKTANLPHPAPTPPTFVRAHPFPGCKPAREAEKKNLAKLESLSILRNQSWKRLFNPFAGSEGVSSSSSSTHTLHEGRSELPCSAQSMLCFNISRKYEKRPFHTPDKKRQEERFFDFRIRRGQNSASLRPSHSFTLKIVNSPSPVPPYLESL